MLLHTLNIRAQTVLSNIGAKNEALAGATSVSSDEWSLWRNPAGLSSIDHAVLSSAIRRMASTFDIYSAPGQGTALLARVRSGRKAPANVRLDIGAVSLPKSGETLNGDDWLAQPTARGGMLMSKSYCG